jgi:hypothetical protein
MPQPDKTVAASLLLRKTYAESVTLKKRAGACFALSGCLFLIASDYVTFTVRGKSYISHTASF